MIRDMGGEMDIAREISRILFVPFFLLPSHIPVVMYVSFSIKTRLSEAALQTCSYKKVFSKKFTGEHPCRSASSIKLLCKFIEIAFRHGCSPVYLM